MYVNDDHVMSIIKQRIFDVFKQELMSDIENSSRGHLYQHLIDNVCLQYYLSKPVNRISQKYIAKYRLSAHNLNIERGRYQNINRPDRKCDKCSLNDLEDEFHFILKCPYYDDLRKTYIKPYYYKKPSVFKLIRLLSVQNVKELNKLCQFLMKASKRRSM